MKTIDKVIGILTKYASQPKQCTCGGFPECICDIIRSHPKQCSKCTSTDKLNNDGLCYGCACLEPKQEVTHLEKNRIMKRLVGVIRGYIKDEGLIAEIETDLVFLAEFESIYNSQPQKADSNGAEEWLKKVSPHENIGVRHELIKSGLYKVVVNMMDQFANSDKEWVSVEEINNEIAIYKKKLQSWRDKHGSVQFMTKKEGEEYYPTRYLYERIISALKELLPNPPKVK